MSQNGSGPEPLSPPWREAREPAFNAPWPALLLAAGLLGLFAWQQAAPNQDAVFYRFGLIPLTPDLGRRLLTSLFVHGNWAHVLMNAFGLLAFGAGVCRLFGVGPGGAAAFFAFFLVCGVLAGWGYLAVADSGAVLIGASGGIAGLMAAASRVLDRQRTGQGRRLAPFTSPTVVSMAGAWLVVNLLIAVFGFAPGMEAVAVAWEAHLFGYAAGLLLIGPVFWALARLRGRAID